MVHDSPEINGEVSSVISLPYKFIPASSLKVSRAPSPQGLTPAAASLSQSEAASVSGSMTSKPSSPV